MKRLIDKIRQAFKSEFVLNASKLMTGAVLSQVLPILAAPILSRIYSPADYGVLGLYMSVTGLMSMLGTLQYANAIVIAKNETEVSALIKLSMKILAVATLITFVIILFFHNYIGVYFNSSELSKWLWVAPLSVLMSGLSAVFGNYAIRHKQFTLVSSNRVITSVVSTACSITIGYFFKNPIGLFIGLWIGQLINGLLLAFQSIKKSGITMGDFLHTNTQTVRSMYINFPKYSLPADFINNFTNQVPLFLLNSYGTIAAVGNFNMSNRILGLPIGFISNAFGEVFRQKAAQDYRDNGSSQYIFIKTFKTLLLFSIIPFGIIILWGDDIFAFFLGEKWREAGVYASIMAIMFFFRFTISPLSYIVIIRQKQFISLLMDSYLFLSNILIFYISLSNGYTAKSAILYYSLNYSFLYLITLGISYSLSKK